MEKEQKPSADLNSLFSDWMKSATEFWGNFAKIPGEWPAFATGKNKAGSDESSRKSGKVWDAGNKIFQAMLTALSHPETLGRLMKGADAVPDILSVLSRQTWDGFLEMQKQWMEHATRVQQHTEAYHFEDMDQNFFQGVRNLYEQEFKKFLNIPPLGLTRFHQEKFNQFLDSYTIYQTSIAEFIYVFYVPLEKTSHIMQDKILSMAEAGELHDNYKEYYNMWVKVLEGHYMSLLKSPEYTEVMDRTIEAVVRYKKCREDLLCDVIQQFPVPTNRDMDALYREIYLLKKQVKDLSKKLETMSGDVVL